MLLESRFTVPTADCPNPERWHSPDDASTETEITELVAAFVRALQPEIVVETGTSFGYTAEAIGKALKRNGHGRLYTMDTDAEMVTLAEGRCAGLPVTILHEASSDFTPPGPVGFAWLDSEPQYRIAEAHALRPYLAPGAFVGIHDTAWHHNFRPAVQALCDEGWLRPVWLPTPRGVMFAEVLA
jgi:predicted O-methyltransferase YrrM